MKWGMVLGLAILLAAPTSAQTLKGTARNKKGTVRVSLILENGRPKSLTLDYSIVQVHPDFQYGDYGMNLSTYQGMKGSMWEARIGETFTYDARLRFSNWKERSPGSYRLRAVADGTYSYEDQGGYVTFTPESGGPTIEYMEPANAYSGLLDRVMSTKAIVTAKPEELNLLVSIRHAGMSRATIRLRKSGPNRWAISVITERNFLEGDVVTGTRTIQKGILHAVSGAR